MLRILRLCFKSWEILNLCWRFWTKLKIFEVIFDRNENLEVKLKIFEVIFKLKQQKFEFMSTLIYKIAITPTKLSLNQSKFHQKSHQNLLINLPDNLNNLSWSHPTHIISIPISINWTSNCITRLSPITASQMHHDLYHDWKNLILLTEKLMS